MRSFITISCRAMALASLASAQQFSTYCMGAVCYTVSIPAATASSGTGDIFFQITGPSSMSWIGLGQGDEMMGSNIFMIYADAAGTNVTLSPRKGVGEVMPLEDMTAQVTLLGGSGIASGMMTANVQCSNCSTWDGGSMSFTDPSSKWIWAFLSGPPISSDSASAMVEQHSTFGTASIDLQSASGGSSANPFANAAAFTSTSRDTTGSVGKGMMMATDTPKYKKIQEAHGIIGPLAFAVLFPLGAMSIRFVSGPSVVWLHAGWMSLIYTAVTATVGLGIFMAKQSDNMSSNHAIIGLVVFAALFVQPVSGLLHHAIYKRRDRPDVAEHFHVWFGRAVIVLGVVNGGLGLKLSGNSRDGEIAYGVVAGVIGVLWGVVIVVTAVNNKHVTRAELGETGKKVYRHRPTKEKEKQRERQESQNETLMS